MIGFSRFGQIVAQILLAGGRSVTVIDQSADRIRQASRFGFRIYFGDGTRKDVLESPPASPRPRSSPSAPTKAR
jgi:CPA2 family monovalent cation:H+ antiporter-2